MEFRGKLEGLKVRFLVWLMLAFRLRPRAVDGFSFAKAVHENRE